MSGTAGKLVVYKAVFRPPGDDAYDRLYPPECPPEDGVAYVIFRDVPEPYVEHGWHVLPARFDHVDRRLRARHHKCCPHLLFPDAAATLWLDGSLTPKVPPSQVLERHGRHHVATFDRVKRDCLYDEGVAMARKRRDEPALIHAQLARYRREGYPAHNGLCATTAVLRRNTSEAARFGDLWWEEIARGCNRDQVSANYVLWKLGMDWGRLQGQWNHSPLFTWRPHYGPREAKP